MPLRFVQVFDGGRIHRDDGVYFCFACQKALSPWDLAKVVTGNHETAKRVMIDLGLFTTDPHTPPTSPNATANVGGNGDGVQGKGDIIEVIAKMKGVTRDAFLAYRAKSERNLAVAIPMYGPDGKACSTFRITLANSKGMNEKGKHSGMFFPGRRPKPGETLGFFVKV